MGRLQRILPLLALFGLAIAVYAGGAADWLNLEALRNSQTTLSAFVAENRPAAVLIFIAVYAAAAAMSVPGAVVLTLAGGLLFGVWLGGAATVVGATIGAVCAFYVVRLSIGDGLRRRAQASGGILKTIIDGVQRNAFAYVLSLRLVPLVPFWLVNVAAGLAHAPMRSYAMATLLGIVPGSFIYSGIGAGMGRALANGGKPDLGLIFEPRLLVPLLALAALSAGAGILRRRIQSPAPDRDLSPS